MKPTHHDKKTKEVSRYMTSKHSINSVVIVKAIGQLRYCTSKPLTRTKVFKEIKYLFYAEGRHWVEWFEWDNYTNIDENGIDAKIASKKICKALFPEYFELYKG